MSLLDVVGSRAQRSAVGARRLYAEMGRRLIAFSATKVVLVPPRPANGRAPVPAVASAPSDRPAVEAPGSDPAATGRAPGAVAPAHEAAVPTPPAAPSARPSAPAPVPEPTTALGTAVRQSWPIFAPRSPAQNKPPFSIRPRPRDGDVVIGEQSASGARLREARRLNVIAIIGVAIGILNLIGLIVAIAFSGSMLHAIATASQSSDQTTKIDRRAWLGLGNVRLEQPYSKSRLGMALVLENTGKTPATVDGIDVTIDAVESSSNRRVRLASEQVASGSIAPGARQSLSVFETKPLSNGGFADLTSGRVRHEFAIVLRYHDVFGDAHRTLICKALEGAAAAMAFGDSLPACSPNAMD